MMRHKVPTEPRPELMTLDKKKEQKNLAIENNSKPFD